MLLVGCSAHPTPESSHPVPPRLRVGLTHTQFSDVKVLGGALHLTVRGNWSVTSSSPGRVVRHGGVFVMAPNAKAELSERHATMTLEYLPPEGLLIDYHFYGSSLRQKDEVKLQLLKPE